MRNFTFNLSRFSRHIFFIVFLLTNAYNASAQFYKKHYIAPAPWQYFNNANEIVIATNSTTTVKISVSKSDGTLVTNLTAIKGTPAVYRFTGTPSTTKAYAFDTVLNGAGLIVEGNGPISINLRNVASDALSGTDVDKDIKGNAALTSFGDAGLGIRFRVGYYRDGTLGNFGTYGDQRPIYCIMATVNNTTIKINNTVTTTLNAGQSYLFKAPIGTLVESSNLIVMNTSAAIDTPGGCGDSAYNQIPPEAVLGTEYFLERGTGNSTAEQTTIVATKDDTTITIEGYSTAGTQVTTNTVKLNAGKFYTFVNGSNNTSFTASHIVADKRVVVYSGTAQGCEVDISSIAPVSECGGSKFIETSKFKDYNSGNLDYFGYILLRSASDPVTINGIKTTSISGVGARYQIGSTGWYIINFNSQQIGRPEFLTIESESKLTVSIVQQAGGFSMAGFFSTFAEQPEDPTLTYIEGGGCTNNSAELTTPPNFEPYQWYYNGTAIPGANSASYIATKTGNYSVSSTLVCGAQTPSKTVAVTLCTDLGITKTVDNITPCIGSNVEFTVKVSNLGGNNVSGVSVTDLLPSGYTYASSTPSVGVYNSGTGIWTIGDVEAQSSMTLKIVATVNASGNYTNTASLPNAIDTNTANNSASAAVNPKLSNLVITNPAAVCSPSKVDLTASSVTTGSTSNMTLSYWTNAAATTALTTPSAVTTSGTYYIKAVSADGCQFIKPVVATITAQTGTPTISASGTCTNGSVILSASGTSGTYLWSTGETTKDITVTTEGSYTVQRTSSGSCISNSSTPYVVTFIPSAPSASDQIFCSSENKTVGNLVATGSNIKWYSANSGGTALPSNQLLVNNTTYYATQTVNGCESTSRIAVLVTVNTKSSAPVAAASQSFCAAENKKVGDLAATGGTTRKWYNVSSGGTPISASDVLSNGDYYVSQTANSCGESDRTKITVTINTIPSAPSASAQTFCSTDNRTVSNLSPSGAAYKWYDVPSGGSALAGTVALAAKTYYVTQTNSCGESSRTAVSVTVNNTPVPTASSQTFCAIDATKVNNLVATGTDLKWYSANTGGTLYTGNEVLSTGTYYVTQTLNNCESLRTAVSVTVNNIPAPTASAQTFCSVDAKKVIDLTPSGAAYKWYNASTGGTLYTGSETLANGNYYVSQTVNGCESSRTLVTVTVNPTPTTPTISADGATTFCQGESVTLTSTGGSSYLWSTGATTQSIVVSASGNYSVQVTNATGCPSAFSTPTSVTINPIPAAPSASAQSFCSAENKTINDLLPSGATYKWYSLQTGGSALASTDVLTTRTYYVSQTTNNCESTRTAVSVTINATPAAPTASAQSFCSADNKTVNDLLPTGASYKWYTLPTGGSALSATDVLTTRTYYVSQTTSLCEGPRTSVAVTVNLNPAALTLTGSVICSSTPGTGIITSSTSVNGVSYQLYNSSNTAVQSSQTGNGSALTWSNLAAGTGYYVISSSSTTPVCTATSNSVNVTTISNPLKPTFGSVSQPVCGTSTGSLTITNYNPSYNYVITPSGAALNATTGVVTAAKGTYTITASFNGCTSDASDSVKINSEICANDDPSFTAVPSSTSVTVGNVTANDTLNGSAVTASNTDVTPITTGPLSIDAEGVLTLAPNTVSGTYKITYQLCETGANPANCDTAEAIVVVKGTLDAKDDPSFTAVPNAVTSVTIGNVTANDTLNGAAVTASNTDVTPITTGPLSIDADGVLTLAPNTVSGTYKITYQLCETGANPANCDTAEATVVVKGTLDAKDDSSFTAAPSSTSVTVGNVTANDTLNGAAVTTSNTDVTPITTGPLSIDADGVLTLAPNTVSGTYKITYTLCETGANPANCDTAEATVVVKGTIKAAIDTITPINGNIGGTTVVLTANDTLNGNPVVIGTNPGEVSISIVGTLQTGLTLNANGTITVSPSTPKGDYNVEYVICEVGAVPANCDSVTIVVPVTSGDLVANPDTVSSVVGLNTNQTLNVNVLDNDTKNGQKLDPSDVNLTVSKPDPKGYLVLNPDGTLTLEANAPAGDYELEYTICEKLNPSNCKSNTVTVTVTAPKIEAVADPVTSINGNIGGTTISLTANDKLNGNPAVVGTASGEVSFEIIGTLPSGFTLNPDHTITVAPNTPAGDYNIEYRICENTNPTNCDSVISVVTVTSGDLVANPDTVSSVVGSNTNQTLNVNVLDNDTKNGQKLDPSDVNLTVSKPDPKGYLVLNPDGTLTLGANAPAGNYELEYTICEKLNPSNCKSNTVTVTVTAPKIEAVADPVTSINGNIGGTTISLTANDKLNGNPAVVGTASGEVSFEIIGTLPSGFTLNPDHTITVAPNTPAGDYNIEYRICENTNPTNCDSVISVVKVTGGNLIANEDLVPSAVGVNVSQTLINVFTNDTKNGNALVPSDVNLTLGTDPKGYLTIDANGNVILAPNAPAGDYELPYTICEKLNPSNCSSNVVKVTVTEPKMTVSANSYCSNNVPYVNYTVTPDNFTTTNQLTVKWIDSANNVVATQTNLPLSGNIIWPGAVVDGSGNGVDWPGWILNNGQWTEGADGFELTRNGVKMEFSLNPTVTVSVAYPAATSGCNARPTFSIKANNDEAGPIDVKKGMNASLNIFANDFVNGVNPNPSDVILSTVVANPNLTLNTDGSINIAANTPNGVYELTYQICEAANTSNCSQATIKITVLNTLDPASPASNEITLSNDNNISVDGINGSLEFVNVLDNDLINGQPINPADVVVKPLTTNAYFEWNADGTVNVKPNTPGGNYPLTYQVCEKADPLNCSTAVLNVFVEVPAIAVIKTAVFNDEDKSGYANAGETITYKFTVTNTGNVPLIGITITDPLTGVVVSGQPIDLNVNESNETNFTAVYKITQEDINLGSVSNQAIAQGKSSRGVVVEDKSDDSSNNGDNPTVLDLNGCAIKVFKAFSPNGDEKNARFFIRGIECYPDNTVEIYNRWGVLVFSIDQYNNTDRVFLGYSNGRSTIKQTDGLPVGTYFYILKYKDSAKNPHEESGYLYINK